MKKSLIFAFLVLLMMACSIFAVGGKPTATPTTGVEVVYRPVKEMNLDPTVAPTLGLKETAVPTPQAPLVPEAQDQNVKGFQGQSSDVSMETGVIMVPSRTERSIDDLIGLLLLSRRPGVVRVGGIEMISLGNIAGYQIILIGDRNGYILVFVRNNIIGYVIGIGRDFTLDFLLRAAELMDQRITAPPSATEIARATEMSGVSPTSGVSAPPSTGGDCGSLGLTPEECANYGTHTYSWEHTSLDSNCNPGTTTHQHVATTNFSDGRATQTIEGYTLELSRTGLNQYFAEEYHDPLRNSYTMVFTLDGFTVDIVSDSGTLVCHIHDVYKLIK